MSEHAGNCGYVQRGVPCDCGLWEQSATLFEHLERIRELESGLRVYGSHHAPCPKSPHHDGYDFSQRCTCGLDDLMVGL
jgi:hypothetical protein